jgi:3-demethoxyubiquinol 3-hydroxylase
MLIDNIITAFDKGLRTVSAPANSYRTRPDANLPEVELSEVDRKKAIALMRINHVGEVCAQALYSGQAFTSKNNTITQSLKQAADEEIDHLAWCESRITELGGRKSILNPIWYGSSFGIGVVAGMFGDAWNLGFLAETEKQVGAHLESHLKELSNDDVKTRKIVEQMHEDELAHAHTAQQLGAKSLPILVKSGMKFASKIMTKTAYYI